MGQKICRTKHFWLSYDVLNICDSSKALKNLQKLLFIYYLIRKSYFNRIFYHSSKRIKVLWKIYILKTLYACKYKCFHINCIFRYFWEHWTTLEHFWIKCFPTYFYFCKSSKLLKVGLHWHFQKNGGDIGSHWVHLNFSLIVCKKNWLYDKWNISKVTFYVTFKTSRFIFCLYVIKIKKCTQGLKITK